MVLPVASQDRRLPPVKALANRRGTLRVCPPQRRCGRLQLRRVNAKSRGPNDRPQAPRRAPQSPLARRCRHARVRSPFAIAADRLRPRRLRRQARDRHPQHLERDQPLPRAPSRARRRREARRAGGRRIPDRIAGDVARRAVREALDHDVSQLPRHGDRGAASQPPDRRRGADGRLRQDHARPDHGRDQHGHSRDLRAGRPDAARQLARRAARLWFRRLEILGRKARRPHHRGRLERDRRRHRAFVRHLHGDGYGSDHDGDHRGAGTCVARRVVDPGGRLQAIRAWPPSPGGGSSTWCGTTSRPTTS